MNDNVNSKRGLRGIFAVLCLVGITVVAYFLSRPDSNIDSIPDEKVSDGTAGKDTGEASAPVKMRQVPTPAPVASDSTDEPAVPNLPLPKPERKLGDYPKELKLSKIGLELLRVEPGTFMMGSPPGEPYRRSWENQHKVTISEGFWLGKYEVTQKEWQALGMKNQSYFKGPRNPAENLSWFQAVEFCRKLTTHAKESGELPADHVFRLPTEAEWEYACRAGVDSATAFGDSMSSRQANFDGKYPCGKARKGPYQQRTMPVGFYAPNPWGLHDMHGNIWEWCHDFFTDLSKVGQVNPWGPRSGRYRVAKGGGWLYHGWECRSTSRCAMMPSVNYNIGIGFRVALGRSRAFFKAK